MSGSDRASAKAAGGRGRPRRAIARPPAGSGGAAAARLAKSFAQQQPARRRRLRLTADHGVIGLGLVLALTCGAFGTYMVTRTDVRPTFFGAEHLTVFAKLKGTGRGEPREPGPAVADRPDDGLDPIVTGTVPRFPPGDRPEDGPGRARPASSVAEAAERPKTPLRNYVVRGVADGAALVASRDGAWRVRPGAVLPEAGRVIAIEKQGDIWVVFTTAGVIQGRASGEQ